ncbi:MAG: hypothetical protein U0Q19_09710 [Kineosporiaceae bacterium]
MTALTWGQLAAWLDRIVAKADPRELAEQIADNLERRNVSFRTAGPGTGRMTLTASVEAIEAIRMALLGYASAGDDPDHHRPAAAIRADIITDLITRPDTCTAAAPASGTAPAAGAGAGDSDAETDTGPRINAHGDANHEDDADAEADPGHDADPRAHPDTHDTRTPTDEQDEPPTCRSRPPSRPLGSEAFAALPGPRVHVTVPLSAVLGGEGIGEINDYGPLTAETIRDLLAGLHRMGATATWRCLITDDNPASPTHGTVLGIGKAPHALVRTATGLLRELVQAREQCCTLPRLPTPGGDLRGRPPHPPQRGRRDLRVQPAPPVQAPPPAPRARVHPHPGRPGYRYADHPVGHPHRTHHHHRERTPTLLR